MLRVLYISVATIKRPQSSSAWTRRQINLTRVVYLPYGSDFQHPSNTDITYYPTYSRSKITFPFDVMRIASKLHTQKPFDLIVADDPMGSGLAGYWLKRRFKIPLLIKCHTQYFGHTAWIFERPYYPFYYFLARFLLSQTDLIQVGSRSTLQSLLLLKIPENKIRICPTPIQTFLFDKDPQPIDKHFRQRLLFVGRFEPQKGLFVLLEAMRFMVSKGKKPCLQLVGAGPLLSKLEKKAQDLKIDDLVEFVGFVPPNSLSSFYQQCDVFVLPSFYEGIPKVLIEAAFCGAPIVTTNVCGNPEAVIPEKTALLVPPNDPQALAAAINELLENPERAKIMGIKGREFALEHFNIEEMRDAIATLWYEAAGKNT